MPYPKLLSPTSAEANVQQGSDIVVIPYSSYMEPDGTVRLSVFSEMTTLAAGRLYQTPAQA